jgi:hypothetical protein
MGIFGTCFLPSGRHSRHVVDVAGYRALGSGGLLVKLGFFRPRRSPELRGIDVKCRLDAIIFKELALRPQNAKRHPEFRDVKSVHLVQWRLGVRGGVVASGIGPPLGAGRSS